MLIIFGIALLISIAFGTYLVLDHQSKTEKKNKALRAIGHKIDMHDKGKKGDKSSKVDHKTIAKKLKDAKADDGTPLDKKSLRVKLMQAGLKMNVMQFWTTSFFVGCAVTLIVHSLWGNPVMTVFAAIIGLLGLPKLFVKMKATKRQKLFLDDFSDALEAMARLLKAGMPVGEAIAMCAREYTGPVGEEMRRMYDSQKVGVSLPSAAAEAALRMPLTEMRMLATALVIQQQTGSSLSEVLENLAGTIRARYRLKRKIIALSAEAKMSAMIIGALPLLVTGALKAVNPEYIALLFLPGLGQMLLYGAIIWMSIGVLVMRQMINFKI